MSSERYTERDIHQALGLAKVKLKQRHCPSCGYYVKHLDWCRMKLCPAPGSCPERAVTVGFEYASPNIKDVGRTKRRRPR